MGFKGTISSNCLEVLLYDKSPHLRCLTNSNYLSYAQDCVALVEFLNLLKKRYPQGSSKTNYSHIFYEDYSVKHDDLTTLNNLWHPDTLQAQKSRLNKLFYMQDEQVPKIDAQIYKQFSRKLQIERRMQALNAVLYPVTFSKFFV